MCVCGGAYICMFVDVDVGKVFQAGRVSQVQKFIVAPCRLTYRTLCRAAFSSLCWSIFFFSGSNGWLLGSMTVLLLHLHELCPCSCAEDLI